MKIIHVFRSPVGGLFRHVCDLAEEQRKFGHDVGVVCDSLTGGKAAELALSQLQLQCNLGLVRFPISILPSLGDYRGSRAVAELVLQKKADVIHGHGAKGGVYARLAARKLGVKGVYSPHGGSLHYEWLKLPGTAFLVAERLMRFASTGIIFVCQYEKAMFEHKIGLGSCASAVIYNGLQPREFAPRRLAPDATDFLFVGEMRRLKGVDVLLQAIAQVRDQKPYSLTLVGDGRDLNRFQELALKLKLTDNVRFVGRKSMSEALPMGRVLVMPSRHESFPYVVLEAVAAAVPVIASKVGGIPEILPPSRLVEPDNIAALAQALLRADGNELTLAPQAMAQEKFSVRTMTEQVCRFYEMLH